MAEAVDVAREHGAIPVFVTPPARIFFNDDGTIKDGAGLHGGNDFCYVRAMKQLAEETHVPVIDLFSISKDLFEEIGPEQIHFLTSIKSGVNKGVWPNDYDKELKKPDTVSENTHLNKYGAYILACKMVQSIHNSDNPQLNELKKHVAVKTELIVKKPEGLQQMLFRC